MITSNWNKGAVLALAVALGAALGGACSDDDSVKPDSKPAADLGNVDLAGVDLTTSDTATSDAATKDTAATDTATTDTAASDAAAPGFAASVQPIFTSSCSGGSCHGGSAPKAGLNLTSGNAYAGLVGVASLQCTSLKRVEAGAPGKSYLVQKVEGAGSCFVNQKMPVGGALTTAQIATIKAWIKAGAAND